MPVLNRSADRFQRALEGERLRDPRVDELVATGRHLSSLGAQAPGPDPAFVTALRVRLMAEAELLPAPTAGATRAATARRAAARATPVVVVLGRGLPRALAGAAASAVLVGGVVGVVSRSAVPGDSLYPVKGWVDGVAVRLATTDFERGTTYLAQAQGHISDSRDLAARPTADAGDIETALTAAAEAVRGGQQALDRDYASTGNPQALLAQRDFTARALPQVEALRSQVPTASLTALSRLESLLRESQVATARRLAACGGPCGQALTTPSSPTSLSPTSLPDVATRPGSGTAGVNRPGPTSATAGTGQGGVTVPQVPVTDGAGGIINTPEPGTGPGGVSIGGTGATTTTLPTGGATAGLPSVSPTVPLPTGTTSAPLPSVTIGTGGVTATAPSTTLGSVTLPGATITLP